ncbi:MAG: hypothetical protein GY849_12880 [Deltaproteobacteria bacterium]|nr:hypothetical protein [Deltaproteobacteria bacterium]
MRYLSLREVLELHDKLIEISGGARGIRDMPALESAINQPRLTFDLSDEFQYILEDLGGALHAIGHFQSLLLAGFNRRSQDQRFDPQDTETKSAKYLYPVLFISVLFYWQIVIFRAKGKGLFKKAMDSFLLPD